MDLMTLMNLSFKWLLSGGVLLGVPPLIMNIEYNLV